jgi:hypothetical protein
MRLESSGTPRTCVSTGVAHDADDLTVWAVAVRDDLVKVGHEVH